MQIRKKTRKNVLRFVSGFHDFASANQPPSPLAGEAAVITITCWLDVVACRGPTVPEMARYALVVLAEALGINLPLSHPAVVKATKLTKPKTKHDPIIPAEFVSLLEKEATNKVNLEGVRVYCILLFL